MNTPPDARNSLKTATKLRWPQVLLIVLATMVLTAGLSYWLLSNYLFLTEFEPVELNTREQQVLDRKLSAVGLDMQGEGASPALEPEPYSEVGASREVRFNERELNAMLATNTDLAQKLAIDLSDDLVSAKWLVPLEEDFPVMGGKTVRINAGMEFAYRNGQPVVVLKGVSLMGVPIPNAWLGNLKNVDLIREFGGDSGFWQSFSDGVEHIQVRDGLLVIKLRE
ncbi:arginine N-succinyltransferase [Marinobacter changyiensis]|uniref:arginine N-succinyltransferase n=1 Tax=Marinobacter changyiensis TaxID=2604091 RepID=UPI00126423D6|nr:arginine N-succinyltransferase [Marinobacter changyiensis]